MSDIDSAGPTGHPSLKDRLREELRHYLIVSAFLYVCFGALQLYKTALLEGAGVHYLPLGVAAVKALIIGKFLLVGDALWYRAFRPSGRGLGRIVKRVLWLLLVLVLLTIAEELIVGLVHGRSIAEVGEELHSRSPLELFAEMLLMGLILLPLVATIEVRRALGPGALGRMLSAPPRPDGRADDSPSERPDR
jgi:hypothetical protein